MRNRIKIFSPAMGWILIFALVIIPFTVHGGEIRVGMSAALTGPAQSIGINMKQGIEACFAHINESGGINGNTVRLISYDDGYEPESCAANMRKLIDEDKVIAVIGNTGAASAVVSVPIAIEKKILLFGSAAGSDIPRKSPPDRYIFNCRASYEEEMTLIINGLHEAGIKPENIAFFTQNDGYGDAAYNGAVKALKAIGYKEPEKLSHGRYTRNTVNVEGGLAAVLSSSPQAVIMAGTYKPCAAFIKMAKNFSPESIYINLSSVGSIPLAEELGASGEGVIVTQVVPLLDTDVPIVKEFQNALAQKGLKPDFTSLEGYIAAKIFIEGLKKAGTEPSSENLADIFNTMEDIDIGAGFPIKFSGTDHQASHKVWSSVIKDGKYQAFNWSDLKKSNISDSKLQEHRE